MVKSRSVSDNTQESHHPRLQLNENIHQPVRLSILSILAQSKRVDFAFLRNYIEVGDSNLSRHLTALEELGYIEIEKVFERKRPRTWVSLSTRGREAFEEYVLILRQIVAHPLDRADSQDTTNTSDEKNVR